MSSASSSISDANDVVYVCYACKKEIPPTDLQIIDFDLGPNPMFIKPFHYTCIHFYYENKDDIEIEREEELKLYEKEKGPGYRPPKKRRFWGRFRPRLINQTPLMQQPRLKKQAMWGVN